MLKIVEFNCCVFKLNAFSRGNSLFVCSLTQQEQVLAQSQGGCFSLGGAGSEAKAVDIIQMLTKARTEYEKVGKDPEDFWEGSCNNVIILNVIRQRVAYRNI